jgi:Tropinone reductase 1
VKDKQDVKFIKRYIKKTPLNRMADPNDIPNACLIHLSNASSYIRGATLPVDGGWSCI